MPESAKQKIKDSISTNPNNTCGLLKTLEVALNNRYETIANIDVRDGITNGTTCIPKQFVYLQCHNPIPSMIWVQFDKAKVGSKTRSKYKQYYTPDIDINWTPIFAIKKFSSNKTKNNRDQTAIPTKAGSCQNHSLISRRYCQ